MTFFVDSFDGTDGIARRLVQRVEIPIHQTYSKEVKKIKIESFHFSTSHFAYNCIRPTSKVDPRIDPAEEQWNNLTIKLGKLFQNAEVAA